MCDDVEARRRIECDVWCVGGDAMQVERGDLRVRDAVLQARFDEVR